MSYPVVRGVAYVLAHTPHLARHGSKPMREIAKQPGLGKTFEAALRGFDAARDYAPHQVYIGNQRPEFLANLPKPWHAHPAPGDRFGPFGEIVPEAEFYAPSTRLEVIDIIVDAARARRMAEGEEADASFGPDDYEG